MKKALLSSCIILAPLLPAKAQDNVIKINVLSPIVKTFNVSYEKKLNKSHSFQLGFFYTGYSTSGTSFSGFGITPEYRFYLSDTDAPQGVYLAPFLRYQSFSLSDNLGDKGTFSAFGGGAVFGKQWIFKGKVSLDMFVGPSYYSGSTKVTSGTDSFSTGAFNGFSLRTGLCFGFAF